MHIVYMSGLPETNLEKKLLHIVAWNYLPDNNVDLRTWNLLMGSLHRVYFSVLLQCSNYYGLTFVYFIILPILFTHCFNVSMLCANVLLGQLSVLSPRCPAWISIVSVHVFTLLQVTDWLIDFAMPWSNIMLHVCVRLHHVRSQAHMLVSLQSSHLCFIARV